MDKERRFRGTQRFWVRQASPPEDYIFEHFSYSWLQGVLRIVSAPCWALDAPWVGSGMAGVALRLRGGGAAGSWAEAEGCTGSGNAAWGVADHKPSHPL